MLEMIDSLIAALPNLSGFLRCIFIDQIHMTYKYYQLD